MFVFYRSRMFLLRSSTAINLLLAMHLSNWRNLTNSWANRFIFSTRDPKFVSKSNWVGHVNYIGFHLQQKVEGAAFSDDKEPLWSTNFKRSIASILQVDLSGINNYIYSDKEVVPLLPITDQVFIFPFEIFLFSYPCTENAKSTTTPRLWVRTSTVWQSIGTWIRAQSCHWVDGGLLSICPHVPEEDSRYNELIISFFPLLFCWWKHIERFFFFFFCVFVLLHG